jgi:D-beta-D-heptose 7-phosphate kinase/D-beta-D-heptose 1-phosphate adenosyltransferase
MRRSATLHDRFCSLKELVALRDEWRKGERKVVFTNGVFDLLHRGHITYLEAAAKMGDVLVVGINDDASVRRLGKGEDRPIVPEEDRALILAALRSVEAVVLFGEDTPQDLIQSIEPDVLVKGGDYDAECTDPENPRYIVGSKEVRKAGGTVVTIDLVPGRSTTSLASRIKGSS